MASADGKLSDADIAKGWNHLRTKGPKVCPSCGKNEGWNIGAYLGSVPVSEKGSKFVPNLTYLSIPFFCKNCGCVMLYAADTVGITQDDPTPVEGPDGKR